MLRGISLDSSVSLPFIPGNVPSGAWGHAHPGAWGSAFLCMPCCVHETMQCLVVCTRLCRMGVPCVTHNGHS